MPPRTASRDDSVPLIWVQAGPAVRVGHVAIADKDPLHPNGEIYVASPQEGEEDIQVEVARTATIMQALGQQRLVEVPGPKGAEAEELRDQQARSSTSLSRPSATVAMATTPNAGTGKSTKGTGKGSQAGGDGSETGGGGQPSST